MSRPRVLTSTSYSLLGLLAIKPWTTYELAQQMDRTLNRLWPRARSKLYEEPKKLVAHGLAQSSAEAVGRRGRTVYSITDNGRQALAGWIAESAAGPTLEYEQMLKVFFAAYGTTDDLLRTLHDIRAWAQPLTEINIDVARTYLAGTSQFQHRAAVNQLVGRFLDDFLETVDRWAQWATSVVETWPDDPAQAEADWPALEQTMHDAIDRTARWRAVLARRGPGRTDISGPEIPAVDSSR